MLKRFLLAFMLAGVAFMSAGCISINSNNAAEGVDGGVFKSTNKGTGWQQKVLIPTSSGRPRSFSGINVASMAIDPSDHMAIYFGTEANGLVYTYDGGNNWQTADTLAKATINSVAIDPKNKCNIYTAIGNRVFKSDDCNRNWSQVYFDNDLAAQITDIAIDHFNSANIYIGVSRGDVIKSFNYGSDWQTIYRVGDRIEKILVDPNDSRKIYITTNRKGAYMSPDNGANWNEMKTLRDAMKDFKLGTDIKELIIAKDEAKTIFLATYYGMLKSVDSGETWTRIELIPTERKATINAMAIGPAGTSDIYYVTGTTFYRSTDGGENWATIKLPTTRAGWALITDPEDANVIYMGVRAITK